VNEPNHRVWLRLLRAAAANYLRHHAQWLAAALAYFAAFATAPLIIVLVEITGALIHNREQVLDTIFLYLQRDLGPGTGAVREIVESFSNIPRRSLVAQIAGWVIFMIAALGLFNSVQFALNTVWDVPAQKRGVRQFIRRRALGFLMMLIVAGLLMLLIFINAAIAAASGYLSSLYPGLGGTANTVDLIVSFLLAWLLFAMVFVYLPDGRIGWRNVWVGAGLTSLLFVVGQSLLGWYLGRAGISSAFGAFGSLIAFLLWANYSAQIFLFGAEFTHVYSQWRERAD
jgi:membrane protein